MITVKELRKQLKKFPDKAKVWAYEGEGIGLAIDLGRDKFDWIETGPN